MARRSILFVSSNGAGLGHLTRLMAIARRLPANVEAVFLTLSQALPIVRQQGYLVEYLYSAGWAGTSRREWNQVLADRLTEILEIYRPAAVIFDGTYPYMGMLQVIRRRRDTPFVWSRRGMWRPGLGAVNLAAAGNFAGILEPGELAAVMDRGATASRGDATRVGPMVLCDVADLLDRAAAAAELDLSPDRLNVLLQLGAGNINDIHSEAGLCLALLREDPRVQVVVAESTITDRSLDLPEDVRRVRTYPLSLYYRAFDIAISASGYNTFHEVLGFGVPTLFSPNEHTSVDDQVARAAFAEREGLGVWWQEKTEAGCAAALAPLLNDDARAKMRVRLASLEWSNGAAAAATHLVRIASGTVD